MNGSITVEKMAVNGQPGFCVWAHHPWGERTSHQYTTRFTSVCEAVGDVSRRYPDYQVGELPMEPACPLCRSLDQKIVTGRIWSCQSCGAIHGECLFSDSLVHVRNRSSENPPPIANRRYFSFLCHDAQGGVQRRSGWYDPRSRLICPASGQEVRHA